MYCPYCGQLYSDVDNFCSKCGRRRPVLLEPLESVRAIFEGTLMESPAVEETDSVTGDETLVAVEVETQVDPEPLDSADEPEISSEATDVEPGAFEVPVPVTGLADGAQPEAVSPAPTADADPPAPEPEVPAPAPLPPTEPAPVPAAAPAPESPVPALVPADTEADTSPAAPRAVRRAAPFIAASVPDPDAPPEAPSSEPYLPWGTHPTAARMLVAAVLSLIAAAAVLVAPLVSFPALPVSSSVMAELFAALAGMDARLSALLGGLLGSGDVNALGAFQAALVACGSLDDASLAVAVGLVAGAFAVAVLLLLAGAISSLVLRRSTPVLIAGALYGCVAFAAASIAVQWGGTELMRALRDAVSPSLADAGVQLPAGLAVMQPHACLVAIAAALLVAFLCAAVARYRWRGEHPAWKH